MSVWTGDLLGALFTAYSVSRDWTLEGERMAAPVNWR